jgi:hypothetical protein
MLVDGVRLRWVAVKLSAQEVKDAARTRGGLMIVVPPLTPDGPEHCGKSHAENAKDARFRDCRDGRAGESWPQVVLRPLGVLDGHVLKGHTL